jgi:hypothetical protein
MLARSPVEVDWNCDAREAIIFYGNLCFLTYTVFKESSEPGVDVTRNVYGCCGDEVVPVDMLISTTCITQGICQFLTMRSVYSRSARTILS